MSRSGGRPWPRSPLVDEGDSFFARRASARRVLDPRVQPSLDEPFKWAIPSCAACKEVELGEDIANHPYVNLVPARPRLPHRMGHSQPGCPCSGELSRSSTPEAPGRTGRVRENA